MTKLEFAKMMLEAARVKARAVDASPVYKVVTPESKGLIAAIVMEPLNAEMAYWHQLVQQFQAEENA